eukprot:CAMPEP_0182443946 /NCGR_PEP_ID=MMETSP1172-20130603/2554_1 /TAXON_ID=708627 /ORGANISM="Timspurckia oligopyrenoides, Strain CCMP3278" /LENGTH=390 /DNA_ID=CAMNT_0024639381 /DNA_START=77 /DNA_END=1249 /DNA_ORIENTATION=-
MAPMGRNEYLADAFEKCVAAVRSLPKGDAPFPSLPGPEQDFWLPLVKSQDMTLLLQTINSKLLFQNLLNPYPSSTLTPSLLDILVFSSIFDHFHQSTNALSSTALSTYPDVYRWFDLIQHYLAKYIPSFKMLVIPKETSDLDWELINKSGQEPVEKESKKSSRENEAKLNDSEVVNDEEMEAKREAARKKKEEKKKAKEAQKEANKAAAQGDSAAGSAGDTAADVAPYRADIRVGKIISAEKHPDADKLYLEKIDVGNGEIRTVCSGLVAYIPSPDLLLGLCLVVCNLKPANMVGIKSEAMVLAATSADGNTVAVLRPPESAVVGERVSYLGIETTEEPDAQLNPKKKLFEKISAHFRTDESGNAFWKDHQWMTSAGPCVAEGISNGTIR